MQNFKSAIILLAGIMALVYACYYEYPPIPSPIKPEDVSFKTHILPMLVTKCSTAQCHDGTRQPNLLPENAYNSLRSGGYLNMTFPEESLLYKSMDEGISGLVMPPAGSVSQLEKDLILTWMAKGAPND